VLISFALDKHWIFAPSHRAKNRAWNDFAGQRVFDCMEKSGYHTAGELMGVAPSLWEDHYPLD
jgi:hypothetical protein